VYVDSVVTTGPIEAERDGGNIGEWRLVKTFPRGGVVTMAGVTAPRLAA
jgi:hypothetical protein